MTSTYHHQYSSFSPFPIDLNEDQPHLFSSKSSEDHASSSSPSSSSSSSSSSSFSYLFFINPAQQQQLSGYYHREYQPLQHQQEANINALQSGSSWGQTTVLKNDENKLPAVCKKQDMIKNIEEAYDQRDNTNTSSVKWMSSKMRLMRKMMSSDQAVAGAAAPETCMHKFEDDNNNNGSSPSQDHVNSIKNFSNNTNNSIRVCADCNTTKTPLWRSGPRGPKSLCNACGIRQRKARRAMAAAQASANGKILVPETATTTKNNNKVQKKERKTSSNSNKNTHLLPFKKRCRFTAQGRGRKNKLCFEDYLSIMLSKNTAFHQQVFPQDEIKEAAILLMALSYGLVHG